MKVFSSAYAPELGEFGLGDFYLPDKCNASTLGVLLIHGGGWAYLDKSSCAGIAEFLCENDYLVYNINYRLSKFVPWPACAADCLKAADFLLAGAGLPAGTADFSRLTICGGSAGGHLALYTGLKIGRPAVEKIIAVSPIADPLPDYKVHPERYELLFGCPVTEKHLQKIAPLQFVTENMPEVFITHAHIDTAVPQASTRNFIDQVQRKCGVAIPHFYYDGIGTAHKIWIPESSPHRLLPEIESAIMDFLNKAR